MGRNSPGVLTPRMRRLYEVACPLIDTSGKFSTHVLAKSPSKISPNPSEVISKSFRALGQFLKTWEKVTWEKREERKRRKKEKRH